MMQRCKIWKEIGIEEARALDEKTPLFCAYCGQPVHLYPKKNSDASIPHFGHNVANPNCPAN
jgi:hypothetical protein